MTTIGKSNTELHLTSRERGAASSQPGGETARVVTGLSRALAERAGAGPQLGNSGNVVLGDSSISDVDRAPSPGTTSSAADSTLRAGVNAANLRRLIQLHSGLIHDLAPAHDFADTMVANAGPVTSGTSESLRPRPLLIDAVCMAFCSSLTICLTISCGVFFGANRPYQVDTS